MDRETEEILQEIEKRGLAIDKMALDMKRHANTLNKIEIIIRASKVATSIFMLVVTVLILLFDYDEFFILIMGAGIAITVIIEELSWRARKDLW